MFKFFRYLVRKYLPFARKENITRKLRTRSAFRFKDRQKGKSKLLILICGYKRPLWPYFFERIETWLPSDTDLCIVCPGFTDHPDLEAKCEEKSWSILLCYQNKISKAINIAILYHPKAEIIIKLDEDIIITQPFFPGMMSLYHEAKNRNKYDLGYIAPLLNINGYSYHRLLHLLNKSKEYKEQFGPIKSACVDIPAWEDPKAASFLWDICRPLDQTAMSLYTEENKFSICPHRFSIGAMLFERKLWEDMNYFAYGPDGHLGIEEIQLAEYCAANALHVFVSEEVLVGHFSFGPQYTSMLEKLNEDDSFLKLNLRPSASPKGHPAQA